MDLNISKATISDLTGKVKDYEVESVVTDAATGQKETEFQHTKWSTYLGYYKKIPELKTAINGFSTWVLGKGFTTDDYTDIILGHIKGWGEDTFNSILWNMFVTQKIIGDAFAEIIRSPETGELINLKSLDPSIIKIIADQNGLIKRYEQTSKIPNDNTKRIFQPQDILHLCNDRIADEIHGTGIVEACEWVINARNEAMVDWKRISHRATIRVLYVDADDITKLNDLKKQYQDAINKGEVLILPGKPAEIGFQDLTLPPHMAFLDWIKYLENFFYQALGIPKVILGGEAGTEASAKISYLAYEQVYLKEIIELENDLWNQLGIKITFNRPISLKEEMMQTELKQPGYGVGFQPTEIMPGRNE